MKKIFKVSFIKQAIFFVVVFLSPSFSNAAIVPCGRGGQPMCRLCDIAVGIHNIMNWAIAIMVTLGITIITIAGIMYMVSAGNPGLIEGAKSAIKNVLIGAIFLLGAWVIVNTVLLIFGADIGIVTGQAWWEFGC